LLLPFGAGANGITKRAQAAHCDPSDQLDLIRRNRRAGVLAAPFHDPGDTAQATSR